MTDWDALNSKRAVIERTATNQVHVCDMAILKGREFWQRREPELITPAYVMRVSAGLGLRKPDL